MDAKKRQYEAYEWPNGGWYTAEVHDDGSHNQPGMQTRQNSMSEQRAKREAARLTATESQVEKRNEL